MILAREIRGLETSAPEAVVSDREKQGHRFLRAVPPLCPRAWGGPPAARGHEGCSSAPATDCPSATSSLLSGARALEQPPEHQRAQRCWKGHLGPSTHSCALQAAGRVRSGSSLTSTTQVRLEGTAKMWSFQTQLSDTNRSPEGGAFGRALVWLVILSLKHEYTVLYIWLFLPCSPGSWSEMH